MPRTSTLARILNGAVANPSAGPLRIMPNTKTGVGTMSGYVDATPGISSTERSIAIAYLALFGRSPERAGLSYWIGRVGESATLAQVVDIIKNEVSGAYILDTGAAASIALIFYHLLGKIAEDDPAGQAYWVTQLNGGTSLGTIVQQIVNVAPTIPGYAANTLANRLLILESICRIQKSQGVDLSVADSRATVLRVDGTVSAYAEAVFDVVRLLIWRSPSTPLTWGKAWTAASLAATSRVYDNCAVPQVRNLVWYNREGNMLLATVYLTPNFMCARNRALITLHGGGWRQGYPEKIYGYSTALAADAAASRLVLSPTYRLTAYGHTSPAQENDVADFYSLVAARPAFLRAGATNPYMFGESSGGHLACLLGATQDVPRVAAIYPPISLTGTPAVSVGLEPYVAAYAPTSTERANASVNLRWTAARTTRFRLWHGTADAFVPASQSAALNSTVGSKCVVSYFDLEGHGFTPARQQQVIAELKVFFDT